MNRLHLFLSKVVLGAILLFLVSSSAVYAQVTYSLTGTLKLVSGSDPLGLSGQVVTATAAINQSMAPTSSTTTATSSSNTYSGVPVSLAGLSCSTTSNPPVTVTLTDNVDAPDTISINNCSVLVATVSASATIPDGYIITAVPAAIPVTVPVTAGTINFVLGGQPGSFDLIDSPTLTATGTAPPTVTPSITSWTPSSTVGSTVPLTQKVTFTTTPSASYDAVSFLTSATTTGGGNWLSVTPMGTNPAGTNTSSSINITVNPTGLTLPSYTGSVTLNYGPPYTALVIPVTITLAPPPVSLTGPSSMTFNYTLGDASPPASQTLTISTTPASSTSVTASVTSGNSWLSIAPPTSGTTPANFTISVNTTGLSAGTLNGNIQITSAGATNSPFNVPVSFAVAASTLTVPGATLTFNYTVGGSTPAAQMVNISGTAGIAFTTSTGAASAWLSATASGTVPQSINVSINPAGLAGLSVGQHTGTVTVTSTGATGSPGSIPVTLNVTGATLTASPSQLNFNYQLGSATQPAAQPISIGDASDVSFTATPATTSGGSWLSVTPGTGNASGNLSVAVNTTGLAAGVYNGTVTIAATGATSQVVNVTLTVASVTAAPSSLNFAYQIGGTAPNAQTVTIGGTPGLTFSASTAGGSWLSATAVSPGTIPGSVSVSVNTTGLAANTYKGTVSISAPGAATQTVNITLVVSSSPTISASPSALNFTYTLGNAAPAAQTITVGGSSGLIFTATAATTPASTWLSASPVAPGTVAGSANVVINTASLTTPGTYNGTVTIAATGATSQVVTVTLVVSSTVTAAPPSLSFAYTLGGTAPAAQSLSIAGSGGVSFTTAAATTSGGSWLVATPVSPGTVPGSASVSINTAALTTGGTYKGTVTVGAAGDASPQVVDVTLVVSNNITVSPSALNFTYTVGGTAPAAQPITVSGTPAGLAFTAVTATTAGGSWLVAAPVSPGTTPGSANVSVNTNGLAAGKYTGTVTIGANLATAQVVAVTLTVTSQPTITLNTNTLTFNYQIGSTAPAAQTLTITGTTGLAFTATVGSGTPWLSAAPVSPGTAPGSASVSVSTSGLAAGTYNGTVTIAATGATSQPVSVTLVVTQPALTVNTSSLSFTYQIGGTNPNPQTLTITGTTGLAFTATAATTTGGSWLSATPVAPGTLNGSATVAIITTNLTTVGTYSGTVTIAAAGATSKVVNVTLVVTTAPMVPAPTSLSFTYTIGGTAPLPQGLNITGGSGLAYTAAPASGASWLSVATGSSGTLPILLSIGANTTGLTAGKYTSSIIVTAAGAPNSPLSVPVTLTVSGATSTITVSPLSLSFTAPSIGAAPASQTANVSATAATAVTVSTLGGAWLSASLSAGTTPAVVTVAVNQAGLTAGTYTGTVVVTAATATNSPQNISVKLVVSAPATITASPSSLSFTYALGATAPATQSISVTSTAPVSFSTSVTNGSWLTVTSSSASTPATLTVSVNTASLTVATYTATISILSPNASNPEQLVFVSLVVSNKATLTASTASLTFTGQSGGTNPAVQSIGLTGSVAALPFSIATSPSWLSVSASSGTTPSTLVVTVNTAGMAQGSYKGSITITSSTATNSPIIIPVTLNVTAPLVVTGPTISTIVNAASYASNGFSPGAIVSIFGSLLGPQTATSFSVSSQGNVDNALAGVTVTVGGIPAIPLYVQNGQINVILPYTLGIGGQAAVQVSYNNLTTTEFNITLEPADVQIFTADASGTGQGSILNQDFSVNSATNPAAPGSVVQVFGTGAGQLTPVVIAGNVASDTLSWVALPYSATVNGETAKVLYAGSAPALVYGVDQFNVQLPTDLAAGSATIVLAVGDSTSQSSVTVFVQ